MDRTAVAVAGAFFLLAIDPVSGQAQDRVESPVTADLPVSTERVRAALQRPSTLHLPPETDAAQFRIEIAEDYWQPETALEAVRRWLATEGAARPIATGSPGSAPPLISVDLLQLAMKLKDTVNATRRARAQRNARREVQKAIAEFCSAHDCSILEQDQAGSTQEGMLTSNGK